LQLEYCLQNTRPTPVNAAVSENPEPPSAPGQVSPPPSRVGVEFWAMEFFQHFKFLSFRKMNGVEYLARFSSCLIEKGLDKVEKFWVTTFLPRPSVDLVLTA
jgi:hypothetical protein